MGLLLKTKIYILFLFKILQLLLLLNKYQLYTNNYPLSINNPQTFFFVFHFFNIIRSQFYSNYWIMIRHGSFRFLIRKYNFLYPHVS